MYYIRIIPAATRDLERLDKPVARRIVGRINWLAANLDNIKPEQFTADLAGFYKFRVGNYRVVYQILRDERIIIIHQVDHRSEVYRKR